ncbi:hypothetical protein T01_10717 [Trichinella spiralis]|uniref:Uncharacterized protein n=1 Tax=Trichinella spiralis TaxID=6334 RepID=A0A0V1B6E5_TRISP|nr:hypothetical protein T01_10717 [Trichinella spiralis]
MFAPDCQNGVMVKNRKRLLKLVAVHWLVDRGVVQRVDCCSLSILKHSIYSIHSIQKFLGSAGPRSMSGTLGVQF